MKRLLVLLTLFIAACATSPQRNQDLVNRAVDAMGGADAFGSVKTVSVKGTSRQWEPEQSLVAGGEMRFANESTFEEAGDVATRSARIDWVKNFETRRSACQIQRIYHAGKRLCSRYRFQRAQQAEPRVESSRTRDRECHWRDCSAR